jgi:predicted dehydrogenase
MKRLLSMVLLAAPLAAIADDLKIGIIGLDTSHVTAFTEIINNPNAAGHVPGGKVVAAFKSSSADIPSSADRVEEYTAKLQKELWRELVGSIEELCREVDGVLIESVDGRPHLAQARPVIAAKKRLFIDKPIGGSLRDTLEIFRLAKGGRCAVFTSSAYRYYDSMIELKKADVGELRSAISYGPAHLEEHHPDLFWYGVIRQRRSSPSWDVAANRSCARTRGHGCRHRHVERRTHRNSARTPHEIASAQGHRLRRERISPSKNPQVTATRRWSARS